jgi:hypothetical protein
LPNAKNANLQSTNQPKYKKALFLIMTGLNYTFQGYNSNEGTGGNFDFYELGGLNEIAGTERIRKYVFCNETKTVVPETKHQENKYFLGKHNETGYNFNYEPNEITTLGHAFCQR